MKEQLIQEKILQYEYLSILIEKAKSMQKLENIGEKNREKYINVTIGNHYHRIGKN